MLAVPPTLAIVDGDPVAGRALKALLEGAGYKVRSLAHPFKGHPGQLLEGVRLLLLPPTLGSEARAALVGSIAEIPEQIALPIIALTSSSCSDEAAHSADGLLAGYLLPWPSRIEALVERIEAALRDG